MKYLTLLSTIILSVSTIASSANPIICESENESSSQGIWPSLYLSDEDTLCFNVKGWPGYSGTNCVKNGTSASWTGIVIIMEDGESLGRNETNFRVVNPTVTDERIVYNVEWSRGDEWRTMQDVEINRITGGAVSYFTNMHGGESYQCKLERKAI